MQKGCAPALRLRCRRRATTCSHQSRGGRVPVQLGEPGRLQILVAWGLPTMRRACFDIPPTSGGFLQLANSWRFETVAAGHWSRANAVSGAQPRGKRDNKPVRISLWKTTAHQPSDQDTLPLADGNYGSPLIRQCLPSAFNLPCATSCPVLRPARTLTSAPSGTHYWLSRIRRLRDKG